MRAGSLISDQEMVARDALSRALLALEDAELLSRECDLLGNADVDALLAAVASLRAVVRNVRASY